MARKRDTAVETISQVRTIEVGLGKGLGGVDACHKLGMTHVEGGRITGGERSLVPATLAATAKLSCEMLEAGRTATQVHSKVRGKVPNADAAAWGKIPAAAKTVSPISRLLHATNTMNASKDG